MDILFDFSPVIAEVTSESYADEAA